MEVIDAAEAQIEAHEMDWSLQLQALQALGQRIAQGSSMQTSNALLGQQQQGQPPAAAQASSSAEDVDMSAPADAGDSNGANSGKGGGGWW